MGHNVLCIANAWKACLPWGGINSGWCIGIIFILCLAFVVGAFGFALWLKLVNAPLKSTYVPYSSMETAFLWYCNKKKNDDIFRFTTWPLYNETCEPGFNDHKYVPFPADRSDIRLPGENQQNNAIEETRYACKPFYGTHEIIVYSDENANNITTKPMAGLKLVEPKGNRRKYVPRTQLVEAVKDTTEIHCLAVALGGLATISTNLAVVFFGLCGSAWARFYMSYNIVVLLWTMPMTIICITRQLIKIQTVLCAQGMTEVMADYISNELMIQSRCIPFKSEEDRHKWLRLTASCNLGSFDPILGMEALKSSPSSTNVYNIRLTRRNDMYTKANVVRDTLRQTCGGFLSIIILSTVLMTWEAWWPCDTNLKSDVTGIRNNLASTILVLWNLTVGLAAVAVFNLRKAGLLLEYELKDIVYQVTKVAIRPNHWIFHNPCNEVEEWFTSLFRTHEIVSTANDESSGE